MVWLSKASQLALSLSSIFSRPTPPLRALLLELSPHFDADLKPRSIDIRMKVENLQVQAHAPLLLLHYSNALPNNYSADEIDARDVLGRIPLVVEDGDGGLGPARELKALRSTEGDVTVEYTALVLTALDEHTPCIPASILAAEKGGFSAAGLSFLLQPVSDVDYNLTYSWDLSAAPVRTRVVCTFGEGSQVSTVGRATQLGATVFALGQINSYPAEANKDFGLYWFDDPPFNTTKLGMDLQKLAREMASFFEDPSPLLRIFIRHYLNLCAGGTAMYRTFTFGWTSLAMEQRSDADFLEFLAHETVHNWPVLDVLGEDQWYNEGIAEYYSIVLSYRFGIYTRQMFIERMNRMISGYYTNPDLHMSNAEAAAKFWSSDPHANRILYQRGFTYFVSLGARLSHSPSGQPSLDDLIRSMLRRSRSGKPADISDFLSLLSDTLGPEVVSDYDAMVHGSTVVPPADSLGRDYTLRRTDQEQFYLGFNESSFSGQHREVRGLDLESRAAIQGGVLEGDRITSNHSFFWAAESWEKNFTMVVVRRGKLAGVEIDDGGVERNVTLTWWPRSWEKVSSWQWWPTSDDVGKW